MRCFQTILASTQTAELKLLFPARYTVDGRVMATLCRKFARNFAKCARERGAGSAARKICLVHGLRLGDKFADVFLPRDVGLYGTLCAIASLSRAEIDEKVLHIYSTEVYRKLKNDEEGWSDMVTPKVADYIRKNCLFGFPFQSLEFEY